jgi:hypothetical protein
MTRRFAMIKRFFIILAIGVFPSVSAIYAQDSAPMPTYKDGDTWQFRATEKNLGASSTLALGGDYDVSFRGGEIRVRPVGRERGDYKEATGLLKRMIAGSDEEQLLQFPLVIKKKWDVSFRNARRGMAAVNVRATTEVTGIEEITTAAGRFRVFKLERYETSNNPGKGGGKTRAESHTYYYSPDTRSIVQYRQEAPSGGTHEVELVKFTAGE